MLASKACHLFPVTIVCFDIEGCSNQWGDGASGGLCMAPLLPSQGDAKPCHNTWSTCLNKSQLYDGDSACGEGNQFQGYRCGVKRYYFSDCEISKDLISQLETTGEDGIKGVYLGPVIKNIKYKTGTLSSEKLLATRSTLDLQIRDFDHSDIGVDPYFKDREWFQIRDANAKPPGTFWGRFLARNKYYKNTRLTVYEGDCEFEDLSDFEQSTFFIDRIESVDNNFCVNIKALDPVDLADDRNSTCPKPLTDIYGRPWHTTVDISERLQNFFLPASAVNWYGDDRAYIEHHFTQQAGFNKPQYICIGDEIMRGEIVVDTNLKPQVEIDEGRWCHPVVVEPTGFRFKVTQRGAFGTEISEHEAGEEIILALQFIQGTPITEVIYNIFNMCTGVTRLAEQCCDDSVDNLYLDTASAFDRCVSMKGLLCDVVICDDKLKTRDLLEEIAEQFGMRIFYNDKIQKIQWQSNQPPNDCDTFHFDECDYEERNFSVKRRKDKKYNSILYFYDLINPVEDLDDGNFRRSYSVVDTDSTNCAAYGELLQKVIQSRWHCHTSRYLMECMARQQLERLACDSYDLEMTVDKCAIQNDPRKSQMCVGNFFTVNNCKIQDTCGYSKDEAAKKIWQVTGLEPQSDGCIRLKAENTVYNTDQCWLTALCNNNGEPVEDCKQAPLPSDVAPPILVEGSRYHCDCKVH